MIQKVVCLRTCMYLMQDRIILHQIYTGEVGRCQTELHGTFKFLLGYQHGDPRTAINGWMSFTKCPCSNTSSISSRNAQDRDDPFSHNVFQDVFFLLLSCNKKEL